LQTSSRHTGNNHTLGKKQVQTYSTGWCKTK